MGQAITSTDNGLTSTRGATFANVRHGDGEVVRPAMTYGDRDRHIQSHRCGSTGVRDVCDPCTFISRSNAGESAASYGGHETIASHR